MKLSRDYSIDTLLIVAGLVLGCGGLISLADSVSELVLSLRRQAGFNIECLRDFRYLLGGHSIRLAVAGIMVLRPQLIRKVLVRYTRSTSSIIDSDSREFWLYCVQTTGLAIVTHSWAMLHTYHGQLHYSAPMSISEYDKVTFSWVSILIGVLAVLAPSTVSSLISLKHGETTAITETQLGDLPLRRSALSCVIWLFFCNLCSVVRSWWQLSNNMEDNLSLELRHSSELLASWRRWLSQDFRPGLLVAYSWIGLQSRHKRSLRATPSGTAIWFGQRPVSRKWLKMQMRFGVTTG